MRLDRKDNTVSLTDFFQTDSSSSPNTSTGLVPNHSQNEIPIKHPLFTAGPASRELLSRAFKQLCNIQHVTTTGISYSLSCLFSDTIVCCVVPHLHKGVKLLDVGIGEMVGHQKSLRP